MDNNTTAPPSNFKKKVKKSLDDWHKPNVGKSPLEDLSLFRENLRNTQLNHRRLTNEILLQGIQRLEKEEPDYATYLQQRYLDENSVIAITHLRNISESTAYELQKLSVEWLTTVLWDMERERLDERQYRMLHRLEGAEYVELIGRKNEQKELLEQLGVVGTPYIVSVTGMGGIGKTSLTDSVLRRVIEEGQFDEIGWVTVREQRLNLMAQIETMQPVARNVETIVRQLCLQLMPDFPLPTNFDLSAVLKTLERHVKQTPHLIVIDNLETLADVRDLFPTLQRLSNPTKFLLTSRESLYGEPNIYHYPVPALGEADALNLIRHEANLSRLPVFAESSDEELRPLYETVGGNPLALRLVVGLAHHQDLDDVLDDLRSGNNDTANQLYTYIYRQSWDKLTELDRQVLLTMSTIKSSGESLEMVVQNSGLSRRDVRTALSSLVILNLVNVHGILPDRRYQIHSLTKSFLLEQVLMWS